MPCRPKRPCREPGCANTHRNLNGYCDAHQRRAQAYDLARASAAGRGYGRRWDRARRAFLARHPLCAECQREGRVTPASVVDHVRPHKGDLRLFWDSSNWQPLCKRHHDQKTAGEGAFGRPRRGEGGVESLVPTAQGPAGGPHVEKREIARGGSAP